MPLPSIRLEASCHHFFTESGKAPPQSPWLWSYYQGLLAQFDREVDQQQMDRGKNNDFLTMATHVMQTLKTTCQLDDVGLFLMAHQTLDTYYPFRSTTTMLCREFGIESPAVAVTEHEQTSPYVALTILLTALRQKDFKGSGLLLVLDQATLPYGGFQDAIDTALVMKFSTQSNGNGATVDGRHYWMDEGTDKSAWVMQCIRSYLHSHTLDIADVNVVTDENLRELATVLQPTQLSMADSRFMSCGSLLSAMNLLNERAGHVLLAHMAQDDHLYLFLFRSNEAVQLN